MYDELWIHGEKGKCTRFSTILRNCDPKTESTDRDEQCQNTDIGRVDGLELAYILTLDNGGNPSQYQKWKTVNPILCAEHRDAFKHIIYEKRTCGMEKGCKAKEQAKGKWKCEKHGQIFNKEAGINEEVFLHPLDTWKGFSRKVQEAIN